MGYELNKQQKKSIEDLGKKEVREYGNNLFNLNSYGGAKEADALIKRYKSRISLTKEDEAILRKNVPEEPKFDYMSEEQYRGKGCWKQYKYRGKVEGYFKGRKAYYSAPSKGAKKQLSKGQLFALKKQELEARFAAASIGASNAETTETETSDSTEVFASQTMQETVSDLIIKREQLSKKDQKKDLDNKPNVSSEETQQKGEADELLDQYKKDGLFDDIEEDPGAMDAEYQNRNEEDYQREEYEIAEQKIAEKEIAEIKKTNPTVITTMKNYCYTEYTMVNKFYRSGIDRFDYNKVIEVMKKNPLKKDCILRRGVSNINTAGFMIGLKNAKYITEDELKAELKERFEKAKLKGTEMIMTDKGFMSTAMPNATKNFEAESGSGGIGIEFIILAKKGTPALNVSTISFKPEEKEIVIAPGTKFKVLDMKLDGDGKILHGNEKSWKIYLSTIPDSEEGILNDAA